MANKINLSEKICIGTANFNQKYGLFQKSKINEKELNKIFEFCKKYKISKIDTALDYKNDNIIKNYELKNFKITTKIGNLNGDENEVSKELNKKIFKSLKTLKVTSFDCILLHDPINSMKNNKKSYLKFLKNLKEDKIVKKIGYSIYNSKELNYLYKIFKPDVIQAPLNIFDNEFNTPKIVNFFKKNNIEFQCRSIFLQGILLKNVIPPNLKKIEHDFNYWNEIRKKNRLSRLQDCINHTFARNHVKLCVLGIENLIQLKKIFFCSQNIQKNKINNKEFINISKKYLKLIKPNNWNNVKI